MFFEYLHEFLLLTRIMICIIMLAFAQEFNYERQSKELFTRLAWPTWHVTNTKGFRLSYKLRSLRFD